MPEKDYDILNNKRELIRVTALLHNIGHYPLSHLKTGLISAKTASISSGSEYHA
ncbi:MAG TPA: HD domain-containing protein [Methanosarcinaceae archaeon]|nr:HD domain-containing protein [Methanosarcinaceae archaeon]